MAGLVLAGAVGVGGVGFGAARAAVDTTIPPGTIHGCVIGTSRTLSHVYTNPSSGTTCPSGSYQVVWPNGPDTDPAPPAVTAGPSGLDVVTVSAGPISTNAAVAVVSCPADHPYEVGGGGQATGQLQQPLDASYPVINPSSGKASGWEARVGPDTQGNFPPGDVTAFAICAK